MVEADYPVEPETHHATSERKTCRAFGLMVIFFNPIVACEIEYGLARRNSTRLRQQVEAILSAVSIVELPSDIAAHYGRIRVELERQGTPIGPYDLLIAAHCFASAITLVTGNDGEFRRV